MEHGVGCTYNMLCHSFYSYQNVFQDLHDFNHLCLLYKSCFEQFIVYNYLTHLLIIYLSPG